MSLERKTESVTVMLELSEHPLRVASRSKPDSAASPTSEACGSHFPAEGNLRHRKEKSCAQSPMTCQWDHEDFTRWSGCGGRSLPAEESNCASQQMRCSGLGQSSLRPQGVPINNGDTSVRETRTWLYGQTSSRQSAQKLTFPPSLLLYDVGGVLAHLAGSCGG